MGRNSANGWIRLQSLAHSVKLLHGFGDDVPVRELHRPYVSPAPSLASMPGNALTFAGVRRAVHTKAPSMAIQPLGFRAV
jgi:hypothetical protein